MSAISLKSITGITSITTPAGVDNQLTLHNNNTTEAVKLDIAGNLHFHNHLNITGVSTASNFKTGTSNLHNTGLNVFDLDVDGHTNLDNVSIAGVTTATGNINISSSHPKLLLTDDTNPDFSVHVNASAFHIRNETDNRNDFRITSDGTNELYHGGTEKLKTTSTGIQVAGRLNVINNNITDTTNSIGLRLHSGAFQPTDGAGNLTNGTKSLGTSSNKFANVYATTLYGDGSNLTGIAADKIYEGNTEAEVYDNGSDGRFTVTTEGNERLRIDSTGRVLVNTTTGFAGDNTMIIAGESPSGGTYDLYDGQLLITSTETSGAVNTGSVIQFYGHDGSNSRGFGSIRCLKENGTSGNHNAYMAFLLRSQGSNPTEKLRITSAGKIGIGDVSPSSDLSIKSSAPGILLTDTSGTNTYGNIDYDSNVLMITSRNNTSPADISFRGYDGTNIKTYMNLTPTGNVVTYNNHLSGTSGHQLTSWYGDDANHYTLEHKDFNEIRAIKTLNTDTYGSIVYKREMMTEYCDIEFTLKGNAPSGTNRHTMFVINGDGSDTFSNYDRLVFRYRPGDTSGNQIRIDKGGGGYGFAEENSSIPNFFDGNERHVHIQIRKRTFSITVNRMGQSEYNLSKRTNADLVSSRGYFGFSLYERASHGNPELTIRDFKITNYTQNAIPSTSVAFQATHSGNPGKSSGYFVKPCNVEIFDNGYGGNYNTSNYRFTAPVAGIYQFGNTFNCYSSPSNMFCAIRVNGSQMYIGNKRNNNTGNGDQNVTVHCIVQLQPGDYVEALDNTSNGVTYSSGVTWNRFEGSLVAAFK